MHGALRILVVDADDRTRESIVGILGIRHRFNVVGSARARRRGARHRAGASPGRRDPRPTPARGDRRHGADPAPPRDGTPASAILALGWSPDLEHQALDAGADGFVRKTFKPGDLSNAIGRCMDSRLPEAVESVTNRAPVASQPTDPSPRPVPSAERA